MARQALLGLTAVAMVLVGVDTSADPLVPADRWVLEYDVHVDPDLALSENEDTIAKVHSNLVKASDRAHEVDDPVGGVVDTVCPVFFEHGDPDADGLPTRSDNCAFRANAGQLDADGGTVACP